MHILEQFPCNSPNVSDIINIMNMARRTIQSIKHIGQGDPHVLRASVTSNPLPGFLCSKVQRKKYLRQRKASSRVQWALKKGWIKKQGYCNFCGFRGRVEAHHYNYDEPLEVEWICKSCHQLFHRDIYNHLILKYEDMPNVFISDGDIDKERTRYISESLHIVENELSIRGKTRLSHYA